MRQPPVHGIIDDHPQGSLEQMVSDCVKQCKTENINDAVEILRCAQKYIVKGRQLDISSLSDTIIGETNFIYVDRFGVMKSTFEELAHWRILDLP